MMSRPGFTLVELLIVIMMISVGLMAVIEGISYTTRALSKTRSEIIAINLAREGMEAVYQIRNTNRLRYSGDRDAHRLHTDPTKSDSSWMQSGTNYLPKQQDGTWILQKVNDTTPFETTQYADAYRLCLQDGKYIHGSCDSANQTAYYRTIIGKGLYDKQSGQAIECVNGNDIYTIGVQQYSCDSPRAKEFRFCSRVVYSAGIGSDVEFCGLITNFAE